MFKSILAATVLVLTTACGTNPQAASLAGNPAAAHEDDALRCRSSYSFATSATTVDIIGFKAGSNDEVAKAVVKIKTVGGTKATTYSVTSSQTKRFSVYYHSTDSKFLLRGLEMGESVFAAELLLNKQITKVTCVIPQ